MATINGKDSSGNKSYISVTKNKKTWKIHIFSPEDASDVILNTKQAKELIEEIKKCILDS